MKIIDNEKRELVFGDLETNDIFKLAISNIYIDMNDIYMKIDETEDSYSGDIINCWNLSKKCFNVIASGAPVILFSNAKLILGEGTC